MIKLIVTDMDGSLLNDKKELPDDFWHIESQLHEKGILFGIASGRPHHNLATVFDAIKDRIILLSDNGSFITYKNEELLVQTLDPSAIPAIVFNARKIDKVYPVLCGKHKAYMENADQALLSQVLQYYQQYEIVDDLTTVKAAILKISLCDLIDAETNSYPHFKSFENNYKVAVAGERWLDFTALNANKGIAIKMLQHRFEITADETLVFGDYLNDLEMMQAAKYSYALKNAHPQIIDAANYITSYDNNHHGVTSTLMDVMQLGTPT